MTTATKTKSGRRLSVAGLAHAERVGAAELRSNLAKYLRQAESGRPVIIQGRNNKAYVLLKLDDEQPASVFGCMREHTEYAEGTVVNSFEKWPTGAMP